MARVSCPALASASPHHVSMNLEIEAGALPNAFDQAIDGVRCERATALGRKDKAAVRELSPNFAQSPDFVAAQGMYARLTVLGSTYM
jgi:hypothetical protein